MRQLSQARKMVQEWRELEKRVADIAEMMPLAEEDTSLGAEIQAEVEEVTSRLDELELELAFSSKYDARNAILAIHAGAGAPNLKIGRRCY